MFETAFRESRFQTFALRADPVYATLLSGMNDEGTARPEGATGLWRLPGYEFDLGQGLLRDAAGTEVPLRPQTTTVLQQLWANAGRVVISPRWRS